MESMNSLGLTDLEVILKQFINVEYGMISYVSILNTLEEFYEYKNKRELHKATMTSIRQIELFQEELSRIISDLEKYILNQKKDIIQNINVQDNMQIT